jgi:hypothetical protein
MTKEEVIDYLSGLTTDGYSHQGIEAYINQVFDYFESSMNCDRCVHYLADDDNFPIEPCCGCSRYYSDLFEERK